MANRHQSGPGLYDRRFEHDACGIGFVVDVKGRRSNQILRQALTVLENLDHRGARGAEANTGDGAGILMQVPHRFLQKVCEQQCLSLPSPGACGVGMLFLPRDEERRSACQRRFEAIAAEEGAPVLGWRQVPTDNADLGESARASEPAIYHVFVARPPAMQTPEAFERRLFVVRRRAERAMRDAGRDIFYVASLSHRTLVYKGMLTAKQLRAYFPDLSAPAVETALALVHSRFSTNTFPNWERAHPNRYLIHNEEINTLRGNVNWMHACLMEPWDGPAAIAFTDGVQVGAVLDRNGLRPARYLVTADDLVVMASETGVLDVPAERVVRKGRLQPGRMLLIDTAAGQIVDDEQLKQRLATERPYRKWLEKYLVSLEELPLRRP